MKFEELVKTISPKVKAIAYRLDGKYTMLNDDDLYQEAMLRLWEKFTRDELSDKTESFIVQGCYFEMKNYIRTRCKGVDRYARSLEETVNESGDTLGDMIPQATKQSEDNRLHFRSVVSEALGLLDAREREVFALLGEGMTTREIGSRLGISHVMVVKIHKGILEKCKSLREED